MGLALYYRRFVGGFAKIAEPLHALTRKGAVFSWTECQTAFDHLKEKLAPVLLYPRGFIMETDASLGVILSQKYQDGLIRPVAYASH